MRTSLYTWRKCLELYNNYIKQTSKSVSLNFPMYRDFRILAGNIYNLLLPPCGVKMNLPGPINWLLFI